MFGNLEGRFRTDSQELGSPLQVFRGVKRVRGCGFCFLHCLFRDKRGFRAFQALEDLCCFFLIVDVPCPVGALELPSVSRKEARDLPEVLCLKSPDRFFPLVHKATGRRLAGPDGKYVLCPCPLPHGKGHETGKGCSHLQVQDLPGFRCHCHVVVRFHRAPESLQDFFWGEG